MNLKLLKLKNKERRYKIKENVQEYYNLQTSVQIFKIIIGKIYESEFYKARFMWYICPYNKRIYAMG